MPQKSKTASPIAAKGTSWEILLSAPPSATASVSGVPLRAPSATGVKAVLDFYIDYAQVMLDRKDYLSLGMFLKHLDNNEPSAYFQVLEVIEIIDKKITTKLNKALKEHYSRLYKKRK